MSKIKRTASQINLKFLPKSEKCQKSKKTKSQKQKPKTRDPKTLKVVIYISIKTYGTGLKLYNTSQSYLPIPLFYPKWGNTHYCMFSFFGSKWAPENTKPGTRPEKQ